MTCFSASVGEDGIIELLLDQPSRSMNTITFEMLDELEQHLDRISTDASILGAVLGSGKANGFCAGADLGGQTAASGDFAPSTTVSEQLDRVSRLSHLLRRMETCGKPIAIGLEGLALGGGLEIALACHYRVASRHPKLVVGLPEVTVGLIPGGGGTQRLPRLIGVAKALPILLDGKPLPVEEAFKLGIVHELSEAGDARRAARKWVLGGDPVQPWDKPDFRLPGGGPYSGGGAALIAAAASVGKGFRNNPAPENILRSVYEGVQVPIAPALRIESRYFLKTKLTSQSKAILRTQFQSIQALRKGAARPADAAPFEVSKATVIGAGMMGAGIAYVQAFAGIETVLIDVSEAAAQKGKEYSVRVLEKAISRGTMDRQRADEILARITPTTDYAQVKGSDIVIEAVFEDPTLKAMVTQLAEAQLTESAIVGSNTSSLPITGLAKASARPNRFIGLHFFSPVDRMALVEVIKGHETTSETLAKALDYVARIKKTPIVVNDSRGFYTSRCFGTYSSEGMELLADGVSPAIIDNVGRMSGMPRGPLELMDDVALDLIHKVREQARIDLGEAYKPEARDRIVRQMVKDLGRFGRKNRMGFYDYSEDGRSKTLWPGLEQVAPVRISRSSPELIEEIRHRLLFRQAIEAARCLDEGIIDDPRSGDVGAVLGWGFAKWTGGPLSLIDMVGAKSFVETCDRFAERHGDRFQPPEYLREIASRGGSLYASDAR